MSENEITITNKEYKSLKEDALFMRALEHAGVDNWQAYDEALDILEEMKEEENNE